MLRLSIGQEGAGACTLPCPRIMQKVCESDQKWGKSSPAQILNSDTSKVFGTHTPTHPAKVKPPTEIEKDPFH